ncbi:MAG: amino acid carrier protein, partial [Gammaproteobacteria bacterium]
MTGFDTLLTTLNGILWHDSALLILLGTGVVFTVWSGFSQYKALTHGVQVVRGTYDDPDDPGAISHFQALSAALSATVGLGNIGGVALAISLGGPGAVFWMWVVGFFGMAVKLTEVTLSMLYRNTDDPDNPHGGPMWVVSKGLARMNPALAPLGKFVGGVFCVTLLVSTITGGNMFQAWNVGEITEEYFDVPSIVAGIVLALLVAMVIIGGIKRIGAVAGRLVPIMVALYLLAGTYVLIISADQIPGMLALIFRSAFSPQEFSGAFLGGTVGYAFLFGMKRALFSNEAGQGSSPIAHSAAKTDEPVREALVAGL